MNFPNRVPVLANPQEGSSMRNVSSEAKTLSPVDASMLEPLLGREDYSCNLANVTILFGILVRFTLRNNRSRFRQLQEGHTTRHGSRGFHRGSGTVRPHVLCVVSLCRTDIPGFLVARGADCGSKLA